MPFKEISTLELADNFFSRIGRDWMLVTAGSPEACNTMTASWGQMGHLWNLDVATIYVRPQRYTYEFVEREPRFSLSFFAPGQRRQALQLLGTKSGRDGDKIAEAGLTVQAFGPEKVPGLAQAALVLVCRKLYAQDMLEACFTDPAVAALHYPQKDWHRIYVSEIEQVFTAL